MRKLLFIISLILLISVITVIVVKFKACTTINTKIFKNKNKNELNIKGRVVTQEELNKIKPQIIEFANNKISNKVTDKKLAIVDLSTDSFEYKEYKELYDNIEFEDYDDKSNFYTIKVFSSKNEYLELPDEEVPWFTYITIAKRFSENGELIVLGFLKQ